MNLMKHLKVWQKLALMGLVFMLPFALVTYRLIANTNSLNIQPAQKELQGTEYIAPLRTLLGDLQEHRSLRQGSLSGDAAMRERIAANEAELSQDMAAVDDMDKKWGASLDTTSRWAALKAACSALLGAKAIPSAQSLEDHTAIIAQTRALIGHVGNTSTLILDPDLDSYYLMDIVIAKGPELSELLGQAQAIGVGIAERRRSTADERRELSRLHTLITYLLDGIDNSLAEAARANNRLQLDQYRQQNRAAVATFLSFISQFINSATVSVAAVHFLDSTSGAMTSNYTLQDKVSPALDALLTARLSKLHTGVVTTLLTALLGLLIVSAIGVAVARDITKPLNHAVGVSEQIAAGNLTVTMSADGRRDEIGTLTRSFGSMIGSLQETAGVAERIAAGDLRVHIQPRSEHDALGTAFAAMVANLQRMTGDIAEAVNILSSSASEIVASTSQLTTGSEETATAVSETTATVEEVRQTAEVSSQKARHVAEAAQQASQISQGGRHATESAGHGMVRIREQMNSIADSMVRLSEQSQAIGQIITTVDDLTQQSNLLAVNAAIEAAKAGEQGKGFAVVAQEVKSLAEQSRQATTQVRSILSDVQKATGAAVMATEQGSKAVEAGLQQSSQAGESILRLTESVGQAAQASTQIAASSQEQLVGMDQVVIAMGSVKQASLQNVDSARQLQTAARDLSDLGQRLKGLVEHYKV